MQSLDPLPNERRVFQLRCYPVEVSSSYASSNDGRRLSAGIADITVIRNGGASGRSLHRIRF